MLAEQATRLALDRLSPEEVLASIDRAMNEGVFVDAFVEVFEALRWSSERG